MRTGVLSLGNHEHRETYYLSNAGVMLYGWQKIDGIWRYFAYEQDAELYGATLGKEYTTDFAVGNDRTTVNFGGAHTGETYYFFMVCHGKRLAEFEVIVITLIDLRVSRPV